MTGKKLNNWVTNPKGSVQSTFVPSKATFNDSASTMLNNVNETSQIKFKPFTLALINGNVTPSWLAKSGNLIAVIVANFARSSGWSNMLNCISLCIVLELTRPLLLPVCQGKPTAYHHILCSPAMYIKHTFLCKGRLMTYGCCAYAYVIVWFYC